jgi:hypothetical protein
LMALRRWVIPGEGLSTRRRESRAPGRPARAETALRELAYAMSKAYVI